MDRNFAENIARVKELLADAEYVLVGGGAGLSAAAGLTYAGKRFTDNFADFIGRYGLWDMYSAGFFPFASQAEKMGVLVAPCPAQPLYGRRQRTA